MPHYRAHIAAALAVIQSYAKGEPLAHHLSRFFSAQKKYGSKDRRAIAHYVYSWFRLGGALTKMKDEDRLLHAIFLCGETTGILREISPELHEREHSPIEQKLESLNVQASEIFPFQSLLGHGVIRTDFSLSFLTQPLLFLRIRPGRRKQLLDRFENEKISFEELSQSALALPPASAVDKIIKADKDAVVQDLSSQQVLNYLSEKSVAFGEQPTVWDCCAGSGGKSILAFDLLAQKPRLFVSDVRENILRNLSQRFKTAGIKDFQTALGDAADSGVFPEMLFDLIICDAPCTGSGTWARTPEQLASFSATDLAKFQERQKRIVAGALKKLKPGGLFFYITCSVFEAENEAVVEYMKQVDGQAQLLQQHSINGYEQRADTMFTAVFRKRTAE